MRISKTITTIMTTRSLEFASSVTASRREYSICKSSGSWRDYYLL